MRILRSIRRWLSDAMEPAEDPRLAFPPSAGQHREVLDQVRAARTSIAASREQLEARVSEARTRLDSLQGRDSNDVVTQQLRAVVEEDLQALEEEIASVRADEEQLESAELRVSAQADAISARQEALRAVQQAAEARARVRAELSRLSGEVGQLGNALEQVERRTNDIQAKASALDRFDALGVFTGGRTFAAPEAQRLAARYAAASTRERDGAAKRQVGNGFKALMDLEAEYKRLVEVLEQTREPEPLSVSYVPSLAEDTYEQGLSVLKDAFDLMQAIRSPSEDELIASIADLEAEDRHATEVRRRIAVESLDSLRKRLAILQRNRGHVDELVHLGNQCAAALSNARLELAGIRAAGAVCLSRGSRPRSARLSTRPARCRKS